MNNKRTIISLLTAPVVTGAFLASAAFSPVAADECNIEVDLQGTVTKNEASVTNHSKNSDCTYDATLAVYDSPKEPETHGWIEAQTLIGSKTVSVKAGETVTIKVEGNGPSCWNQSDLIRGKNVLTPPVYRTAMDTDVYKEENDCKTTVTPTSEAKLAPTGNSVAVASFLFAGVITLAAGLFLRKAGK